ncbi:S8/S53 family peptidase [Crocinitomix catalasitica]|uniref:S8/S53 family peptidase n=1 Tax=Crocinitomix catalasitica TaxID=184607 RepID=UPI000687C63E|nr:S8/S53 family peptidase [Crocinitomix catalasitica]
MRSILIFILILCTSFANAQNKAFVNGELLVQSSSTNNFDRGFINFAAENNLIIEQLKLIGPAFNIYQVVFRDKDIDLNWATQTLYSYPGITIIQKNHFVSDRETIPDDPQIGLQWHLKNTGVDGGVVDADIDAVETWDITTGGVTTHGDTIVVCIIESGGIDYTHEDLAGNMWKNYAEIPDDGIDNDNNGYIDDYLGWDVGTETDQIGFATHGTKVAGLIGAKGNNGIGISGVNWDVKMMVIKGQDTRSEASIIAAFSYPLSMRKKYNETFGAEGAFVVVTNGSWGIDGGNPESHPLWCAVYDSLGSAGILNVGATTNDDVNVDIVGDMPTGCSSDFLIGVTRTDKSDIRDAGYGPTLVDLAAPGFSVRTTNNFGETLYGNYTGTSFASPVVTGAIALAYSVPCSDFIKLVKHNPEAAALAMRGYILDNVDPIITLADDVVTGGRLNIKNTIDDMLMGCDTDACISPYNIRNEDLTDTSTIIIWDGFSNDYTVTINGGAYIDFEIEIDDEQTLILDDLSPCTEYSISIISICAFDDISSASFTYDFITDGCCNNPALFVVDKTQNSVQIGWDAILYADQYNLRYSKEGLDDWTEVMDVDSAVIINDLDSCRTYDFQIYTLCSDSTRGYSESFKVLTLGCGACTEATYCGINDISSRFEWIDEIRINGATRTTGNNLGWYTSDILLTNLLHGNTYTFYLAPGYLEINYTEDISVWIDFNLNGNFEDDEKVLNVINITAPFSRPITIPSDAPIGVTKMRVVMNGEREPVACPEIAVMGEYEDYCVYISDVLAVTSDETIFKVFPNPVKNQLNIETNLNVFSIKIFGSDGKLILEDNSNQKKINTSALSNGLYFVEIESNSNIKRLKFIKH